MEQRLGGRLRASLEMMSIVLTIAVCVTLLWRVWGMPSPQVGTVKPQAKGAAVETPPKDPISIDGAPSKGDPKAATVLVVFSDFQCPFCAKFAATSWPEVDREYVQTGKALVVFRYLPLTIHPRAMAAAEAAECAGEQNQFWQMHDLLFADQANLDDSSLEGRATRLGLDKKAFDRCLLVSAPARVAEGVKQAAALKITGTPTFLIGRRRADGLVLINQRLSGARPVDVFKAALDAVISPRVGG